MQIYSGSDRLSDKRGIVATIGSFDGLHLGHRSVISQLNRQSERAEASSMIISLSPHPRYVLGRDEGFSLITASRERELAVKDIGVDYLYNLPFNRGVAELTAREFIELHLVSKMDLKALLVGYNNHLGSDRASFSELEPIAQELGFELILLKEQEVEGEKVSSTIIRKAIISGDVERAARYMGRPFFVVSSILGGRAVTIEDKQLLPKDGTYFVEITESLDNKPTFRAKATIKNGIITTDNQIDTDDAIIIFRETILN